MRDGETKHAGGQPDAVAVAVDEVGVLERAIEPNRMWRRYLIGNPIFLTRVAGEAKRESHPRPSEQ